MGIMQSSVIVLAPAKLILPFYTKIGPLRLVYDANINKFQGLFAAMRTILHSIWAIHLRLQSHKNGCNPLRLSDSKKLLNK